MWFLWHHSFELSFFFFYKVWILIQLLQSSTYFRSLKGFNIPVMKWMSTWCGKIDILSFSPLSVIGILAPLSLSSCVQKGRLCFPLCLSICPVAQHEQQLENMWLAGWLHVSQRNLHPPRLVSGNCWWVEVGRWPRLREKMGVERQRICEEWF